VRRRRRFLRNVGRRSAAQQLRFVPGSAALRWKRNLRDAAWLDEADAVIVSYPKSGRTFVRAMLARLFQRRFGIDERKLLEFPVLRRAPREAPRLLFTHAGDTMRTPEQVSLNKASYRHAKVVLIARHPGDIAVSRYHHLKYRSRDRARKRLANQQLDTFVWAEQGGIPSIVRFLNDFAELQREHGNVTIIRYEDFLAQPRATLRHLAEAIGLEVTDEDIADAVHFGDIRSLKKREQEGYFTSNRLRPSKAGDQRSSKVRKGGIGGFRRNLGAREARHIDEFVKEELDPVFGY
jgi:hypothetical protein